MALNVAMIVKVPWLPPVELTTPVALLILAEPVPLVLDQVTELVRSCVEPSV